MGSISVAAPTLEVEQAPLAEAALVVLASDRHAERQARLGRGCHSAIKALCAAPGRLGKVLWQRVRDARQWHREQHLGTRPGALGPRPRSTISIVVPSSLWVCIHSLVVTQHMVDENKLAVRQVYSDPSPSSHPFSESHRQMISIRAPWQ